MSLGTAVLHGMTVSTMSDEPKATPGHMQLKSAGLSSLRSSEGLRQSCCVSDTTVSSSQPQAPNMWSAREVPLQSQSVQNALPARIFHVLRDLEKHVPQRL